MRLETNNSGNLSDAASSGVLADRRIVLGITGSIAAYKSASIASSLVKLGAQVNVGMTDNATRFIGSATLAGITHNPVVTSLWDGNSDLGIDHVSLGVNAECILIAPATANTIAKLATGVTDDVITATVAASSAPLVVAPAMDADMFRSHALQRNLDTIKGDGARIIGPETGRLASGIDGLGRMSEPDDIVDSVRAVLGVRYGDYSGLRVAVTAGGTREPLDPVRVITNRSSGKMGYSIAEAARDRGADVTLITAPTALRKPGSVRMISVETVDEMRDATLPAAMQSELLIMAAAISDFKPRHLSGQKIKKNADEVLSLELESVEDWMPLATGPKLVKVAFAAETGDAAKKAITKTGRKGAAFTVANDVSEPGSGFGTDTNRVDLIDAEGNIESLPLLSKYEVANAILDRARAYR